MAQPGSGPTVVDADQVETVVDVIVGAFFDDPLWGWAMPDPLHRREQQRDVWRLCIEGAVRYPWVWLNENRAAASVWIPPGGSDFSEQQAARFESLVDGLAEPASQRVLDAFELLEREHPREEEHYYLSLLGTDPAQLGHGYGLGLLRDNLARIDQEGMPAYLEASNPANVALYQRFGFAVRTTCSVADGPEVTTMWRRPS